LHRILATKRFHQEQVKPESVDSRRNANRSLRRTWPGVHGRSTGRCAHFEPAGLAQFDEIHHCRGARADWAQLIPPAAKQFKQEREAAEYQAAIKAHEARLSEFTARADAEDETLEFSATFFTDGSAPGYRDVYLTFDLVPMGEGPKPTIRATLNIRPEDAGRVMDAITDVHRFAWRNGAPIDAKPDEQRPRWIDGR
jgi:hypothetical protein